MTVQATSDGGTTTLTVTVTVKARPRFDTSIDNQVFTKGVAITPITLPAATHDGTGTVTYTLTPELPDELDFEPGTRVLSGTPTATLSETTFTYTAENPDPPDERTKDGTLTFTITVSDQNRAPVFTEGDRATRSIAENTALDTDIGTAIAATDANHDTLTYTLGGTDASAFNIVRTSGQLQTSAALDYELRSSYSVTVSVDDGNGGTDSITVTITVIDVNEAPVFREGTRTTRSIAENTAPRQNIEAAITATDVDGDTLTYTLSGTDASAFSIVRTSGQLQTSAALDYETKRSYSVTGFCR